MQSMGKSPWGTHEFKVKMLDWSRVGGSRLGYTCRCCDRKFSQFTLLDHQTWAVDAEGRALESAVTNRWLSENCPGLPAVGDQEDRKRLREPAPQ